MPWLTNAGQAKNFNYILICKLVAFYWKDLENWELMTELFEVAP